MSRVIGFDETLVLLKQGAEIHWIGGLNPTAYLYPYAYRNLMYTVRWDVLHKLRKAGLLFNIKGDIDKYPALHGSLRLITPTAKEGQI